MKITESKLREMIRGVIREFTTTATAAGAQKKGYQSADRKSAQTDYDTKKSDYETKAADRDAIDHQKYRKANKSTGGYDYKSTATRGDGYSINPAWNTKNTGISLKTIYKNNIGLSIHIGG